MAHVAIVVTEQLNVNGLHYDANIPNIIIDKNVMKAHGPKKELNKLASWFDAGWTLASATNSNAYYTIVLHHS